MRAAKLEKLLSVSEVAARASKADDLPFEKLTRAERRLLERKMKYRLKRLHARKGGLIIRLAENPNGKIFVTESRLKRAAPELFEVDLATSQEVNEIRKENEQLRRMMNGLASRVRELKDLQRRMQTFLAAPTKTDQK